jgi:hypothetical protein
MKRFVSVLPTGTGAERAGYVAVYGSAAIALPEKSHPQLETQHD